jgi:hypothetical protein
MLGFAEEILLLQLDDTHGRFIDLPLSAADVVLAGAALMELALDNRVDSDLKHLILVDRTPTGDDILDDVLERLGQAAPGSASPRRWNSSPPMPRNISKGRSSVWLRKAFCARRTAVFFGCFTPGAIRSSMTANSARSRRGCTRSC